jgi:lipoprotein-releasing system ATP-binding protein
MTKEQRPHAARIHVEGLHKHYYHEGRSLEVLRGLTLDIAPGESVAITGESGTGKSTFLHVLGTIDQPTEGRVFYDDQDIFALGEEALSAFRNRSIGFVFQFHYLINELTAEENVALPVMIGGGGRRLAQARAEELLERVGLQDRRRHRPTELSGGEQQRVAIARALANRPGVLLTDEPTGNLDERTANDVHSLLLNLNREMGVSFVVTTHNLQLAETMDRHLRLHEGNFEERTLTGDTDL